MKAEPTSLSLPLSHYIALTCRQEMPRLCKPLRFDRNHGADATALHFTLAMGRSAEALKARTPHPYQLHLLVVYHHNLHMVNIFASHSYEVTEPGKLPGSKRWHVARTCAMNDMPTHVDAILNQASSEVPTLPGQKNLPVQANFCSLSGNLYRTVETHVAEVNHPHQRHAVALELIEIYPPVKTLHVKPPTFAEAMRYVA